MNEYTNFKIDFTCRQANEVTYELAHIVSFKANSQLFIDVPSCIHDLLSKDKEHVFCFWV
jgi:hypothetical protein